MKRWRAEFEAIFDTEVYEASPEVLGRVRPGVLRYRTKTTKSGEMLESEVFPIWETGAEAKRARKAVTREAQRRLNDRNAVRKLVRLVSCNFGRGDLMVTLTYGEGWAAVDRQYPEGTSSGRHLPPRTSAGLGLSQRLGGREAADEGRHDFTQVQRDVRNFIRRVRSAREKAGLDELRYVYSIEGFRGEEAEASEAPALPGVLEAAPEVIERKGGVSPRPHVHMILSGGLERDVIEGLWGRGWANCKRLQPDRYTGLEAISRYMVKSWRRERGEGASPEGYPGKRWYGSRNLKMPTVTVSDWRMSRGRVAKAVEEIAEGPGSVFNRAYPGYELVDFEVRSSEFVSGVYLYARMRKIKPDTVRRC